MIHGDYAAYAERSGLDSITQYELWKAIWSCLNDGNFHELAWALARHGAMLDSFTPLTFVGNHDVTRLASRLTDRRHLGHALAILFTAGGIPSVYYGDERGLTGVKEDRAGGDDAVRPAYPATPAGLAQEGSQVYRLHQDLIGLRRRHPWLVHARTDVEEVTARTAALRPHHGGDSLRVLLNTGDTPYRRDGVEVPGHGWAVLTPTETLYSPDP
jgi:glycosidase